MIRRKLRPRTTLILPLLVLALIAASLSMFAASAEDKAVSSDQVGNEGLSMLDMPDVAPPKVDDSISDAELRDLQTVADQFGISLEAAIERYAWNDNFALAVAGIRGSFPEAFAGAEIVDAHNAWIAFKGAAPEAAREMIDAFSDSHSGVSVDVRTNMSFSETELQKGIPAVHYAVLERPEVRDAVTSHDYATGKITTLVVLEDTASDSVLDDLRVVAEQSLIDATRKDILDSISISLIRSTHPVIGGVYSSASGGENLEWPGHSN